jgi:hypothetical protein
VQRIKVKSKSTVAFMIKSKFSHPQNQLGENIKNKFNSQKRVLIDGDVYKIGDLLDYGLLRRTTNIATGMQTLTRDNTQKVDDETTLVRMGATSSKELSLLRKNSLLTKIFEKREEEKNSEIREADESMFTDESSSSIMSN